jgi:hypothetical protein
MPELLTLDGLDMRQEHMGVTTRTGRYNVPQARGENLQVVGRSGYIYAPNRPLEPGVGALACWCVGAYTEDIGRKNLVLNPSFEKAASGYTSAERFRNEALDPRITTLTGAANTNGGVVTYDAANQGLKVVIPSGGITDAGASIGSKFAVISTLGTYNYSVEIQAITACTPRISVQGATLSTPATSTAISMAAGEIRRINVTAQSTTTAGFPNVFILRSDTLAQEFFIRRIQRTRTNYPVPYFDGSTNGLGLDHSVAWAGTVNNSASICTGPVASLEVWRNLFVDPMAAQAASGPYSPRWFGTGGAGTTTQPNNAGPFPGMGSWKKTWTTASTTAADVGWDFRNSSATNDFISVAAGEIITASCWLRTSVSNAQVAQWGIVYYDASNTQIGSIVKIGPNVNITNSWARYSQTFAAAPAGSVKALMYPQVSRVTNTWDVGDTLEIAGAMVTKTSVVLDFFAGGYAAPGSYFDDPDFQFGWTGTANASASVVRGIPLSQIVSPSEGRVIQSFRGVSAGVKSARIITTGVGRDSYAELSSAISGGIQTGKTYTAIARSWQAGFIANATTGNAPRAVWAIATGTVGANVRSTAGTNAEGFTDHKIQATFGPNNYASFRLYNGGEIGGGDIWWDAVAIVEGVYNGSYFDGDTAGGVDSAITWAGTPHDSVSSFSTLRLSIPATAAGRRKALEDNIASVQRLFMRKHRLSTIRAYSASDGSIRRALVSFEEMSDPNVMAGGTRAEFTVAYTIPSVFWEDEDARTQSATAGAALPKNLDLTSFDNMTGIIEDAVITVAGPVTNPRITDAETGMWVQYTGTIATGTSWVVDAGAFTSKSGTGTDLMKDTTHGGSYRLLPISNLFGTSTSPRLVLSGSAGGATTNLSVTARRKWISG